MKSNPQKNNQLLVKYCLYKVIKSPLCGSLTSLIAVNMVPLRQPRNQIIQSWNFVWLLSAETNVLPNFLLLRWALYKPQPNESRSVMFTSFLEVSDPKKTVHWDKNYVPYDMLPIYLFGREASDESVTQFVDIHYPEIFQKTKIFYSVLIRISLLWATTLIDPGGVRTEKLHSQPWALPRVLGSGSVYRIL